MIFPIVLKVHFLIIPSGNNMYQVFLWTFHCFEIRWLHALRGRRTQTLIYIESTKCTDCGDAVNQSRIYQHAEWGWRRVSFHLNHMLSFHITADSVLIGLKARLGEMKVSTETIYGFQLSFAVGWGKDSWQQSLRWDKPCCSHVLCLCHSTV